MTNEVLLIEDLTDDPESFLRWIAGKLQEDSCHVEHIPPDLYREISSLILQEINIEPMKLLSFLEENYKIDDSINDLKKGIISKLDFYDKKEILLHVKYAISVIRKNYNLIQHEKTII